MKHRSKIRLLTAWLLVLLILIGSVQVCAADPEESELGLYFYYLTAKNDGTDGTPIVLELYACTTDVSAVLLEGASFALRFPEYLNGGMTFTPSDQIMVQRIVPTERYSGTEIRQNGYHGFSWTRYASALDGNTRPDTLVWDTASLGTDSGAQAAKGHILVGTYRFDAKGSVPAAATVGQQDWLDTAESEPVEVDPAYRETDWGKDPFNQTVWSNEKMAYIGYYMKEETTATLGRMPLKLVFTPPPEWSGVVNVQSYDPKDPLKFLLYPTEPQEGMPQYYRMVIDGDTEGTGLFVRTVRFGKGTYYIEDSETKTESLPEGGYRIEIQKQSHVTATLTGVTVTSGEWFPELEGAFIVLPCGDVNHDGAIRQTDRSQLTARARYGKAAVDGEPYDLDGDGRVDQKDLSILMAPANYGKKNFTISFQK